LTHALGTAQLAANAFPLRDQAQLQTRSSSQVQLSMTLSVTTEVASSWDVCFSAFSERELLLQPQASSVSDWHPRSPNPNHHPTGQRMKQKPLW
jgi:hypothetical protein